MISHRAIEEDYSPTHSQQKRKVPSFERLLDPILGITGEHEFIKGFKFDIAIPVSEYFQLFQSWEIPNSGIKEEGNNMMQAMMGRGSSKPTYTFTAQLAKDVTSPFEAPGMLMMGKVDGEGRVDSILLKKLSNNLNLKLSANFMSSKTDDGALAADLEYSDNDSEASVKLQHHPMQGLVGSMAYMQRVHKHLMLGFDFTQLFSHKRSLFSYGAKAFLGNHTFYASSIQGGAQYHAGYVIPIRRGTNFVSHYKYEPEHGSTTIIGFKQRNETADITATISSKFKLATILSIKSSPISLKLCAEVDYLKDHYSFGYGVSIGPPQ